MTLDRALEIAEALLHKQRQTGSPAQRVEAEEALKRIAKLRETTKR